MASKKLTDTNISDTYKGVLHARGQALRTDGITEALYDGVGTKTALSVGIDSIQVKGDATFKDASNTGVFLRANEGSIELVDVESKDPYIDFKGNSSVDFDCRIIKTPNNGLDIYTGGYQNRKIAGSFQSDQNFRTYGAILLGRDDGDGFPNVGFDAYRVGTQDSLRLYSDDYIHFQTQDGAGGRQVTATINRTGLSVGRGYSPANRTLDVDGTLRLNIWGSEIAGRVLTCVNSSGDCEWRDSGTSNPYPFGDYRGKNYWFTNTGSRKIMIIIILDGGNDIFGYSAYIRQPGGGADRVAYEYHVSDGYAKDATTMNIIVPPGWQFMHNGDASVVKAQGWEL